MLTTTQVQWMAIAQQYDWLIHAIIFCIMFRVVVGALHIDAQKLTKILFSEFKSLMKGMHTMGAVNALGVLATLAFGLIVIFALKMKEGLLFLSARMPQESVAALIRAANFELLFYCFSGLVLASLICVFLDNKRK